MSNHVHLYMEGVAVRPIWTVLIGERDPLLLFASVAQSPVIHIAVCADDAILHTYGIIIPHTVRLRPVTG